MVTPCSLLALLISLLDLTGVSVTEDSGRVFKLEVWSFRIEGRDECATSALLCLLTLCD